jgi:tetratricopeptide (TPR) repeat protein
MEGPAARLAPVVEQRQQDYTMVSEVLPRLAWACLELGEVGRAQELLDLALGPLRVQSYPIALVDALGVQARVAMRREHWPEALSALSEGLDLARAIPYPFGEGRLLHLMGMLHRRRQEPESALEWLATALAIFRLLGARKDLERTEQLVIALG